MSQGTKFQTSGEDSFSPDNVPATWPTAIDSTFQTSGEDSFSPDDWMVYDAGGSWYMLFQTSGEDSFSPDNV